MVDGDEDDPDAVTGPEYFTAFPFGAYRTGPVTGRISYSYINPWREASFRGAWSPEADMRMVIGGDQNNGSDPTVRNGAELPTYEQLNGTVNSRNHAGEGQNIQYGDGHVEWEMSPYVGVNGDNVYTSLWDVTGTGVSGAGPDTAPQDFGGVRNVNNRDGTYYDCVLLPSDNNILTASGAEWTVQVNLRGED